jgi:PRC-barrel domain
MRIRNLIYELRRPIPLALAVVAAIAVLVAVVVAWQQAEERHDLRRQARLLIMAETTARNELEQMRQTAGTLAAITARTTAQQQELSRLESARAQTQAQLAQVQHELLAQQTARSELAKTMEADAWRAGELRAQHEQVSSGLRTLREESAGLERRVAELKRELEDTQRQIDDARLADARAQQQRERAASDTARAGDQALSASAERRGSAQTSGAMSPMSLRASKLTGVPVIGLDHVSVGEIDDVLIGGDQAGVVVVRTGGILGLGGKLVALPFEQFLWNTGDPSRAPAPRASVAPRDAPGSGETSAERMPGAQISTDALRATEEGQGGRVSADTGPVTTGAAEQATALVVGTSGGPVQAMVRLTNAELEQAPAFRYTVRSAE